MTDDEEAADERRERWRADGGGAAGAGAAAGSATRSKRREPPPPPAPRASSSRLQRAEHAKDHERFLMGPAQIARPAAATALTEIDKISHSAGMYEDRGEEERYDDDDVFLEWSKPSPDYREKHRGV